MKQIVIDGESILTRLDLHKTLREGLQFPEWYGNNLDALHDVLTDCNEETYIKIRNHALLEEHLSDYAVYFLRVLHDCAEENQYLHIDLL